MRIKACRYYCPFVTNMMKTNKTKCQLDGSVRNHCSDQCPHFSPTLRYRIAWWWKIGRFQKK